MILTPPDIINSKQRNSESINDRKGNLSTVRNKFVASKKNELDCEIKNNPVSQLIFKKIWKNNHCMQKTKLEIIS